MERKLNNQPDVKYLQNDANGPFHHQNNQKLFYDGHPLPLVCSVDIKKLSLFSVADLQRVTVLADPIPRASRRTKILQEKVDLHLKSLKKVENWGNTIEGARLKRLAASKEKSQNLEEERKKIDLEWKKIMDDEKLVLLQRSKMLQRFEQPQYRDLHSQILLSTVIMERDRQGEYKENRALAQQINEREEYLKMRLQHLKDLEGDKQKDIEKYESRMEFIKGLDEAKNAKQQIGDETCMEEELLKIQAEKARMEQEKEELEKHQQKIENAETIRRSLDEQIIDKKQRKAFQSQALIELENENRRFNDMKAFLGQKGKEFSVQQAKTRILRAEVVAEWNIKANKEACEERERFLEAVQKSHEAGTLNVENRKAIQKKKALKEKEEFESQHKAKKDLLVREATRQRMVERETFKQMALKWKNDVKEKEERTKDKLVGIRNYQIQQIENNRIKRENESQQEMKHDEFNLKHAGEETLQYEKYTESVLEEWKSSRKTLGPLIRLIDKEKNGKKVIKKDEADHFSRLGFAARTLKSPVIPL